METHPIVGKTITALQIAEDKQALRFVLEDGSRETRPHCEDSRREGEMSKEGPARMQIRAMQDALRQALKDAKENAYERDMAYGERNRLVAALSKLFPSGVKRTAIQGWDPEWHGCVFIDLPTGQASWHFHDTEAHLFGHLGEYQGGWDGHTTPEKYARLSALVGTELVRSPQDPKGVSVEASGGSDGQD